MITKLRNAYYGWYLLVAAVIGMAIASGVSFWVLGYYVTPLEEEFGWSRTLLQTGISVSLLVSGLASPLAGRVVDRYGPRRSIILGTVFTCGTYVLLATTSSMIEWYLYFSINSFFRGFMFYIPFQVLISRWFDRKRGRAVGIMAMGFSLGGFLTTRESSTTSAGTSRSCSQPRSWPSSFSRSACSSFAITRTRRDCRSMASERRKGRSIGVRKPSPG